MKTCSITYYPSDSCRVTDALQLSTTKQSAQNISNFVAIGIPFVDHLRDSNRTYCFVINASNGTHAATVQGALNRGTCNYVTHS